eukprot:1681047-Rhodomonas_salina.1
MCMSILELPRLAASVTGVSPMMFICVRHSLHPHSISQSNASCAPARPTPRQHAETRGRETENQRA